MKRIVSFFIILMLAMPSAAFAHPGGTDSSGGHHDYNNVSGLGSYHYHHGMGPHLHPGGVCPYGGTTSGSSGSSSSSSSSSSSKSSSAAEKKKIKKIQKALSYAVIYDVHSNDEGELTVYWDKDTTAGGYKVVVAQNAKFTKGVKSAHVSKTRTKKTIKGLKSGKKYYAKIISFKKYKGKRVYSLEYDRMGPVRVL